jgi:exonuclease SbcC
MSKTKNNIFYFNTKLPYNLKYIQYCYQCSTDDRYKKIDNDIQLLRDSQAKLADHLKNLEKLIKLYDGVFKQYESDLTNQVGRLFHVYSGRIMNDHQNGMGLFMNSEDGKITFHETATAVNADHDALFSLSSGQINALVLSFMLTMHQTYAKNPLLCIDDPMQTFDDINAVGLINLLRYEFSQNQILLSTHESWIAALITYKFQKFNISTKPINLHELQDPRVLPS